MKPIKYIIYAIKANMTPEKQKQKWNIHVKMKELHNNKCKRGQIIQQLCSLKNSLWKIKK